MKGASVIGRVVPIPQGNWDVNKKYKKLDIVYDNIGKSYIAKRDVPATISLDNAEYWQILAKGTTGPTGAGLIGPTGPAGNVYYPTFHVDLETGILYAVEYSDGPKFTIDDNSGDLYIDIK